jgi:hypothetical protein
LASKFMVKLFSRRELTSWSLETATARPREWKFCYCGRYRLSKFSSSFPRWSGIYHPGSVSKLGQLKYGLNQLFCELFAVSLHASHSDQHRSCCEELLRTGTTLSRPPWRVNPSLPISQRSTPAKVVIAGFRHVRRLSGMHAAPTLSRTSETAPVSNLAASFRHRLAAVRDDNQFHR